MKPNQRFWPQQSHAKKTWRNPVRTAYYMSVVSVKSHSHAWLTVVFKFSGSFTAPVCKTGDWTK